MRPSSFNPGPDKGRLTRRIWAERQMYRAVIAIGLGLGTAFVLRYLNQAFLSLGPGEPCCDAAVGLSWQVLISSPKAAVITLLPAAVAGWVSRDRGLACGFI